MKRNLIHIFVIGLTSIILLMTFMMDSRTQHAVAPLVEAGVLDLSQWNFQQQGAVDLKGKWLFYQGVYLEESDFQNPNQTVPNGIPLEIPFTTEMQKTAYPQLTKKFGGTLRLVIKMPNQQAVYGIRTNFMMTSNRLYVEGHKQTEIGRVGKNKWDSQMGFKIANGYFKPQDQTLEIIYHVSDYQLGDPSIFAPKLGLATQIADESQRGTARDLFLFGMLLIIGIYHLGLYAMRSKDRAPLYFAIFCFFFACRMLLVGERVLGSVIPLTSIWTVRCAYIFACLGAIGLFGFIAHTFTDLFKPWFTRISLSVCIAMAIAVCILPFEIYDTLFKGGIIAVVALVGHVIFKLIQATMNGYPYASLALIGFICMGLSFVNDAIFQYTLINRASMIPVGMVIFVISESFALSLKYSKTFDIAEKLSIENQNMMLDLEKRVAERTKDLQEAMIELEFMSKTDYLTKLPNRRMVFDRIGDLVESQEPFYIILADLDFFKNINDTFGHDAGDQVLIRISETLKQVVKNKGFVGRWGGEEFMMVIKEDQDGAVLELASQMQQAVKEIKHDLIDQALHITITQGICRYEAQYTVDQCIAFADKALYKGKSDGRNCVVLYG